MSTLDMGLGLMVMILILLLLFRPRQKIVYVEKPRNSSIHTEPVNVDLEFKRLFRKIIQRNATVSSYRLMYIVGIAASDTEEPAEMQHWIADGHIYFNFADEIARRQAMEWARQAIIRDHRQLWPEEGQFNGQDQGISDQDSGESWRSLFRR